MLLSCNARKRRWCMEESLEYLAVGIRDCIEKNERKKKYVIQNFYEKNFKAVVFYVLLLWIWSIWVKPFVPA